MQTVGFSDGFQKAYPDCKSTEDAWLAFDRDGSYPTYGKAPWVVFLGRKLGVLSRIRDIINKIHKTVQEIRNITSTKSRFKPQQKDLLHNHKIEEEDTYGRNERDYTHSWDNKNISPKWDRPSNPDNPSHHDRDPHSSPSSLDLAPPVPSRSHTCPAISTLRNVISSGLDDSCSTADTAVQYESSDSCAPSSMTSPPSEELERDSKEGREGEECPDPVEGGGTTGD
jgi:hypothetical protein